MQPTSVSRLAPSSPATALAPTIALAFIAALTAAPAASAQNIFDDFSSGNDNAWTRIDGPGLFLGVPSTYSVSNGQYRLQQQSFSTAPGLVFTTGSLRVDGYAQDSRVSVDIPDWGDSTNNVIGISARFSQPTASTFQYYSLLFFPTSLAGDGNSLSNLRIDRNNADGTIDNVTAFSANAFPRVSASDAYRLVFTLSGSSLTGELYNISGQTPTLIRSVSVIDAGPGALSAGIPGIGVIANNTIGGADATFDNFRVVPAPAGAVLLGIGGLLVARRRR